LVLFFKKERTFRTWRIEHHEEVTSTQDLAIAAAAACVTGPRAYLADRQTAGRGRKNRDWQSKDGNLHFSALVRPNGTAPVPAFWSLMAGLAVHEAVASLMCAAPPVFESARACNGRQGDKPPPAFPSPPARQVTPGIEAQLMLKWPNDLLLNGAKLAGVLIDSALTAGGTLDWVVIGAGINLAHAPTLPGRPTACLAEHGIHVTPQTMAERLMAALDHWRARDLAAIRTAWLAHAHPIGTPLRVQQGSQVIEGEFDGLAANGALQLRGHPPITTGEVFQEATHAAGR
jgi:BirA family biotin operon repressor/biotin-[acetyl-CoA-carboxylase] ligase